MEGSKVTNTCPCCKATFNNLTKFDPLKPSITVRPKFIPNKKQVYEFDPEEFMEDDEFLDECDEMADFIIDDEVDDDASYSIFYCPEELGNSRDMFGEAEEVNEFDDMDFNEDGDTSYESEFESPQAIRGACRRNYWREFLNRLPDPSVKWAEQRIKKQSNQEVRVRTSRIPTRRTLDLTQSPTIQSVPPLSKRRRVLDLTEDSPRPSKNPRPN